MTKFVVLNARKTAKHGADRVYVGRPSIWGNPFIEGRDGDRETVIAKYRNWLLSKQNLLDRLPELAGRHLVCWCAPQACHADILLQMANATLVGQVLNTETDEKIVPPWEDGDDHDDPQGTTEAYDVAVLKQDSAIEAQLADVAELIRRHDVTFEYSDDGNVWRRGCKEHDAIVAAIKALPEPEAGLAIWNACMKKYFAHADDAERFSAGMRQHVLGRRAAE